MATNFATWDGASWPRMPSGLDGTVLALTAAGDERANPEELFVGGNFNVASGLTVNGVARWDGESWHGLGSGVIGEVDAIAFFDDGRGEGPALYIGGSFATASGVPASGVARWGGSSWATVGGGLNGGVLALVVIDDGQGGGPALYAGGGFTTAGGVPARGIARWDGTQWLPLGEGIGAPDGYCTALHVHDDGLGHGPALYVGGGFATAGSTPANNIAKWDGVAWSALGSGTSDVVQSLAVFDDGRGGRAKLIAGGWSDTAGGLPVNLTASWDGKNWSAMGVMSAGTTEGVLSLACMPDRSGETSRLYAARAQALDAWDGAGWTEVSHAPTPGEVALLAIAGTPSRPPSLVVGGFIEASAAGDSFITRLVGCPSDCPADLTFDGIVGQEDLAVLLGAWGTQNGDLDGDGSTSSSELGELLGAWGDCPS